MLLDNEVKIIIGGRNYNYYKNLGYEVTGFLPITVLIEDLSVGSNANVNVECDYCKIIFVKNYKTLLNERKNSLIQKDCRINCSHIKREEFNLVMYGVPNNFQVPKIIEKIKETNRDKYGVEYISQNQEIKNKVKKTRDGFSDEKKKKIKEKTIQTNICRYGVDYYVQTEEYIKKKKATSLEKYETENFSETKKVREKYPKAKDNIKISPCLLDILLNKNKVKLVIEYDCWYWHIPSTDNNKDNLLLDMGYKILRIKSGKKIPNKEILFYNIDNLLYGTEKYSQIIMNDWNEELYQSKKGGYYESKHNHTN